MEENEDRVRRIPTGLRDPLPPGLSYPVGAAEISRALEGVDLPEGLAIFFEWGSRRYEGSAWREEVRARGSIPLLRAGYDPPLSAPAASLSREGTGIPYLRVWQLSVGALPSGDRAAARAALLSHGLAALRRWFLENRDAESGPLGVRREFEAIFDLASGTLATRSRKELPGARRRRR